jgi:transcriptional regulator GlxA family with amidase domain
MEGAMDIKILTFEGADEMDFVAPFEVFRSAARTQENVSVGLVSLSAPCTIVGRNGLAVRSDGVLIDAPDLLVVPGGGWVDGNQKGVRTQISRGTLLGVIQRSHKSGSVIAGVCTGAMALATAGILDRRPATTHHLALEDLRRTGACVATSRVVDAGDVVTCAGVTASLDLSLWLVERFWDCRLQRRMSGSVIETNGLLK